MVNGATMPRHNSRTHRVTDDRHATRYDTTRRDATEWAGKGREQKAFSTTPTGTEEMQYRTQFGVVEPIFKSRRIHIS